MPDNDAQCAGFWCDSRSETALQVSLRQDTALNGVFRFFFSQLIFSDEIALCSCASRCLSGAPTSIDAARVRVFHPQ